MDRAEFLAKAVVAAGLVCVWPGPELLPLLRIPAEPSVTTSGAERTRVLPGSDAGAAAAWFRQARGSCNAVEAEVRLSRIPPPNTFEGHAYEAACLALAGRIDHARDVIRALPAENRWRAAGLVFDQSHPVADAGDEIAAGPVMELVIEFWPNHYMALYHAGASRYEQGDTEGAEAYLDRFLAVYDQNDGWTRNARVMLERLRSG